MIHALLVDDDADLRELLTDYLLRFQIRVTAVADAAGMRRSLAGGTTFDLLLLDLMLPDANGLDLCRWVRQRQPLPIIMLTAQGDPASRIVGLELGADDYLPKPFEPRELVARIQAVLRRAKGGALAPPGSAAPVLRFAGWQFDRLQRQLNSPAGLVIALSNAEARLLAALAAHPKRVLSRERLLALTRPGDATAEAGGDTPAALRAIDLAISRLRQKLGDSAREPALIRTVRGEGYLFNAEVSG